MKSIPYLISLFSFLFWSCSPKDFSLPINPYASWAKESPGLQIGTLPKPIGNWNDRVYPMDTDRLRTLIEINQIDGIEDVPSGTKDLKTCREQISRLFANFPKEVNELANESILGIYFVTNLGSTGLTGVVRDTSGKPVGGIIFLDSDLLKDGGNDWATKRENTTFQQNLKYSIKVQLDQTNSLDTALSYIILHELGHILAIVRNYAPDYSEPKRDFRNYPYFEGVWWSETFSPYEDTFFPERQKIKFYQKNPTLPIFPDGKFLYKKLTNTQFVSLYAATNADDTFAEAFAQYVHVFLLKKEYKVLLITGEESEVVLSDPIKKEGGRKFRELFASIFENSR